MRKIKLLIVVVFLLSFFNAVSAFTTGFSLEIPIYKTFESPKGGGIGFYVNFTPQMNSFYNYFIHGLWKLTEEDTTMFELNNFLGLKMADDILSLSLIGGGMAGLRFVNDKTLLSYGVFILAQPGITKEKGSLGFSFRMLNDALLFYGYEFAFMMSFRIF